MHGQTKEQPARQFHRLGDAFDDAYVAFDTIAEYLHGGLVGWAVVHAERLRQAVELDHDNPLINSSLIGLRRRTTNEEAPACRLDGWRRELRVGR
jgi:hypothetical protein